MSCGPLFTSRRNYLVAMKLYLTYSEKTRDGFTSTVPSALETLKDESVEEIQGEEIIERVPDLIKFVEQCYRVLVPEGKLILSSPYFASSAAWASPFAIRGVSEKTLNFASKNWREQSKWSDAFVRANFEVSGSFAVEESVSHRAEDVRQFWMSRYLNVAQAVVLQLVKKPNDDVRKDG